MRWDAAGCDAMRSGACKWCVEMCDVARSSTALVTVTLLLVESHSCYIILPDYFNFLIRNNFSFGCWIFFMGVILKRHGYLEQEPGKARALFDLTNE